MQLVLDEPVRFAVVTREDPEEYCVTEILSKKFDSELGQDPVTYGPDVVVAGTAPAIAIVAMASTAANSTICSFFIVSPFTNGLPIRQYLKVFLGSIPFVCFELFELPP